MKTQRNVESLIVVMLTLTLSCDRLSSKVPAERSSESQLEIPTRFPAVARIVAFGDVHGDLGATREALRLAGAIDENDHWAGDRLVLVQTGDQLDRGDDEPEILELFEQLQTEASRAGGAFHVLNGNHELLNALGDFRYVTPEGFRDFEQFAPALDLSSPWLKQFPQSAWPRAAAFHPGGPFALKLARRNTVAIIGDNVFVHGGVLPEHVSYGLEKLNREVRAWLLGKRSHLPDEAASRRGVLWVRDYSDDPDEGSCQAAVRVLEELGAERMIVAHTVQKTGISPVCHGKVWCIDVGMAQHYGGRPAVLEIRGDQLRAIQ